MEHIRQPCFAQRSCGYFPEVAFCDITRSIARSRLQGFINKHTVVSESTFRIRVMCIRWGNCEPRNGLIKTSPTRKLEGQSQNNISARIIRQKRRRVTFPLGLLVGKFRILFCERSLIAGQAASGCNYPRLFRQT